MYNVLYMPNLFTKLFTKSVGTTFTTFLNGADSVVDSRNISDYKKSLYLYIAVSMIAKRAAGIPLELYKIKNKAGDVEEVLSHPLLDLLYNPNDFNSQREFVELSITYYLLSGDCFWALERNGSKIVQIYTLRPDRVQIVLSSDRKRVVAYEYRDSNLTRFAPEDIVHTRNVDPENPLRGIGVITPASSRIATEIEAAKYQANFFKNQGRPDLAVISDGVVTKEKSDEARKTWKQIFGSNKAGEVAFLGSNTKIQELNKTPKEMDFIQSQNFLRDDILAALRIPKAMITSDDVNLANAQVAERLFLTEAVVPVFDTFIDSLNNRLVSQVDDSVFIDFTDPVPQDREMMLKEHTAGVGKWITQNEAREETGRPLLEGHDELGPVAFNNTAPQLLETAKQHLRKRPLLVKKLDAMEKMADLVISTSPKREMNSVFPTKAMKESYAKAYNDRIDRKADVAKEAIDEVFEAMQERVLATDLGVDGFMDVQAEKRLAKQAMTPVMIKLYEEGGQAALDALFKKGVDTFWADAVLLSAIEGRVAFFADSIVDTTFEVLKGKIVSGLANGDGPDKIASSLREYFTDMSSKRAKTIARTETGYALSKATNDAYNQSSVVTGKEWLTVGDGNVRPEHVENNGVIVAKGGTFPNGESYPAHHSINCRCVLIPAV